jgi:hypothetical protein
MVALRKMRSPASPPLTQQQDDSSFSSSSTDHNSNSPRTAFPPLLTEHEIVKSPQCGEEGRHHGMYWRLPLTMLSLFFLGLATSIGHHLYYAQLEGLEVGNGNDQQWALRFVWPLL